MQLHQKDYEERAMKEKLNQLQQWKAGEPKLDWEKGFSKKVVFNMRTETL